MDNKYEQVKSIISLLEKIIKNMKVKRISAVDIDNVLVTLGEVNVFLYGVNNLKFQGQYDIGTESGYNCLIEDAEALVEIWTRTIEHRTSGLEIDKRFWKIYDEFKYVASNDIYVKVMNTFFSLSEEHRKEYLTLNNRYAFLNNSIDTNKDDYSLIVEYIEMMISNVDNFYWLYEHLSDYRSRYTLVGIVEYWFDFDIGKLHKLSETVFSDYYDLDIIKCDENEVLVDLGAYIGDSIKDFIDTYGAYKRIYAYEMTPSTFCTLKKNTALYNNIILRQKGVGAKNGYMYTNDIQDAAGNKLSEHGDTKVEVVSIDSDIEEPITLVKMDIEGAEKDAIIGMKNHILKEKTKMMISSYHISDDIFKIPMLINSIRDDYKLYMRFNGLGIWPCDYVLFAV